MTEATEVDDGEEENNTENHNEAMPPALGKIDEHTGVSKTGGYPSTFEHVEELPEPSAKLYRVETFLDLKNRPIHRDVHYVPAGKLDKFFRPYSQTFDIIVDVRPITLEDAETEINDYLPEGEEFGEVDDMSVKLWRMLVKSD
jgi:hypothetical protein